MRSRLTAIAALCAAVAVATAGAQTCTTQAKMASNLREELANTALAAATAIQNDDAAKVQSMASADIAGNFAATGYLVRTTSEKLAGNSLRVTQLYQLDANGRSATDTSEADFSCPLTGSVAETDFGINGLPGGLYTFAMVEASGEHPYLLAFLFRQEGSAWKLAGLYPHTRSAAGHYGLWYWTSGRASLKAGKPWLAWLELGKADTLLRPANFVSSSNLDKLRTERSAAAPPELRDGLGEQTPYLLKAADGATYAVTALDLETTPDGAHLNLLLHFRADPLADANAARARNQAAAKAMLTAHPELRGAIAGVTVFADSANQPPFATTLDLASIS